jgi:hypothetical protein
MKNMKNMKNIIAALIVAVIIGSMMVPMSLAAPDKPVAGKFVNDGGVPDGSKLVLDITQKVTNDEDSGNVGYWALDDYNKHVKVWQIPDGTFYAVVGYTGKWQTFAGALSPGAGVAQSKDAFGTYQGGYTATFSATSVIPTFGNVGTFDYGGTKADILLGTYGAGQTGPTPSFSWLNTYFPGNTAFSYIDWGWTYHYRSQAWYNYAPGTTGDIVI